MLLSDDLPAINARVKELSDAHRDNVQIEHLAELLSVVSRLADPAKPLPDLARALLSSLRRARAFDWLYTAASALIERNFLTPLAGRMKAQALIELQRYEEALQAIGTARNAVTSEQEELIELAGLEGRIYKQLYVQASDAGVADKAALLAAIDAYAIGWKESGESNSWAGANLLALLHRGHDDNIEINWSVAIDSMAGAVMSAARKEKEVAPQSPWPDASLGEAALALGDFTGALEAFGRYVADTDDAFALAGTRRQLREVWRIDANPNENLQAIHDEITAALLQLPNGRVEFEAGELSAMANRMQRDGYEGLFGGRPVPIEWAVRLADIGKCIGRVERRGSSLLAERFGTGTVFKSSVFGPQWPDVEDVFVTNEHVVSGYRDVGLRPEEAVVRFTQSDIENTVPLGRLLWCSDARDHDISIFELPDRPPGVARMGEIVSPESLMTENGESSFPVTVIGHPIGSDRLHLAIENLDVEDLEYNRPDGEPERIWYKCPTMEGNSGSPVLTWRQLEATAIHHRKIEARGCNEGVSLISIRKAIQLKPEGWNEDSSK